jgi:hypothetical protein
MCCMRHWLLRSLKRQRETQKRQVLMMCLRPPERHIERGSSMHRHTCAQKSERQHCSSK